MSDAEIQQVLNENKDLKNELVNVHRELTALAESRKKDVDRYQADLKRVLEAAEQDKLVALKKQMAEVIVPIKQREHAMQLEALKQKHANEIAEMIK